MDRIKTFEEFIIESIGDEAPIKIEVEGIQFISAGKYYDGINQKIAHQIKDGDMNGIEYAAKKLAPLLPDNAVIVPIPGHKGRAQQTLTLAEAIASIANIPVADVLIGKNRESNYKAKKQGHSLSENEMGIKQISPLPKGLVPYILDNVVDTGTTALAAVHALGEGTVISYAITDYLI